MTLYPEHYVPFILFHKNAVTKAVLHNVVASVTTGNSMGHMYIGLNTTHLIRPAN